MISSLIVGKIDWFGFFKGASVNPDKELTVRVTDGNVITWPYYALGAALAYVALKGAKA